MTEKKAVYQTKAETRIGAKDLASLAMPDACPRCFWIKQKCKPLPFQIFPGIFSSIDAYTKKVVHAHFDEFGTAPEWLPALKNATGYLKTPHWSKFKKLDTERNILVSGTMDGLFKTTDGSLIIVDYKTAKFTDTQDKLYPLYAAQLNIYTWIQNSLSVAPVSELYLTYFEPSTNPPKDGKNEWLLDKYTANGFNMAFSAHTVPVTINESMALDLLVKAKGILEQVEMPLGGHGCKDCGKLTILYDYLSQRGEY